MNLGVPSKATNHFAKTEFMTKEDSFIVDFHLIETANSKKVYQINSEKWINPGTEDAAECIYKLYKYLELSQEMVKKSIYAISQRDFIYSSKLFLNNLNERLNNFNRPPRFSGSK
jgi:hypothetical protein